ncbi:MAG: polysaccharide export protein [Acetobacteraceae bacterium]|nr:polysaccharide export protein [Acetobacteraceae bacterium]MBV8521062.1 polysaccharide export protein [Acetobacteraceae bacterium]
MPAKKPDLMLPPRADVSRRLFLYRVVSFSLGIGGLLEVGGCGGPPSGLPVLPTVQRAEYHLGPGDQVRIITFGGEQLTGEFRVDASGDISLPLVGNVRAAGLTPHQLETAVAKALERSKLYKNPSVSVEVVNYRPIFVLGEINKPGQYPYQPGMTVVTAVAVAGGFTYRAIDNAFSIVRDVNGRPIEGRAARQTLVQPGDVITVYERRF